MCVLGGFIDPVLRRGLVTTWVVIPAGLCVLAPQHCTPRSARYPKPHNTYTYTMYIHCSDFTSLYRRIYEVRGAACGRHVVVIGRQPDMQAELVGVVCVPQTGVQAVRSRLFRDGNWRSLSSVPCRHVQCKRRSSRQMHAVPEQTDHAGNHRRRVSHCLLVPTRFVCLFAF